MAQYTLGLMYDKGYGVEIDFVQARKWYQKAAKQGHAVAQYKLGLIYYMGYGGVSEDSNKARKWLQEAAKQGFDLAQHMLATVID